MLDEVGDYCESTRALHPLGKRSFAASAGQLSTQTSDTGFSAFGLPCHCLAGGHAESVCDKQDPFSHVQCCCDTAQSRECVGRIRLNALAAVSRQQQMVVCVTLVSASYTEDGVECLAGLLETHSGSCLGMKLGQYQQLSTPRSTLIVSHVFA